MDDAGGFEGRNAEGHISASPDGTPLYQGSLDKLNIRSFLGWMYG